MSNVKNIKLTPIKQLIDLNGDKVNFDLTFNATSANKVPFDALVVTQKMLDSETPLEYKKVTEGTINGNIVSDKGVYDNYLLLLKSDTPVDCQITIDIKDIPINQEFFRQLQQNNLEQKNLEQQVNKQNKQNTQNNQINRTNKNLEDKNSKNKQLNPQNQEELQSQKKSSKINWKILLLILVICIGGFALWYFYNKNITNSSKIPLINNSQPNLNQNTQQLIQNIPDINNIPTQNMSIINNTPIHPTPSISLEIPSIPSIPLQTNPIELKQQNSIHNQILDALNNTPVETIPKLNSNLVSKINNIPIW